MARMRHRARRMGNALATFLAASVAVTCCSARESASEPSSIATPALSNIQHLVVVVQENHTFDVYFGRYCTAPTGSAPSCNEGPACCEAGPPTDPTGAMPTVLDDAANGAFDPDHSYECMVREINGGKMDRFAVGPCADPRNFAYAEPTVVAPYRRLAAEGALADRYFQPIAGPSSPNNVYFARAGYVFTESAIPNTTANACVSPGPSRDEDQTTVGDLLDRAGVPWAVYAEGYQKVVDGSGDCPAPDPVCPANVDTYPCNFDPGDIPFAFFNGSRDRNMRDFQRFAADLASKSLPSVTFVKAIGFRTEHPGFETTISAGSTFVTTLAEAIAGSSYAADTLVLVTFDEGGGYFDHIAPPPNARSDDKPYGTRVPLLAVGPFARKNWVSHAVMEHSSIVKFIEWNWLGATGQLGTRDLEVSNIGSLLDPRATGSTVPE